MNRTLARLTAVTTATACVTVGGTTQASAVGYSVEALNSNGTVKAVASFNNDTDRFCIKLRDGAVAYAYLAGKRIEDTTVNSDAVCEPAPVTDGVGYALDIVWLGTGGQGTGATTRVVG